MVGCFNIPFENEESVEYEDVVTGNNKVESLKLKHTMHGKWIHEDEIPNKVQPLKSSEPISGPNIAISSLKILNLKISRLALAKKLFEWEKELWA